MVRSGSGVVGGVIAPGAGGVEIGDKLGGQARGEGLAGEFGGVLVCEVLEHGERDEDGVARRPGGGFVAEQVELEGQVRLLPGDGGVDAGGVDLEQMELVWRELGDGAVGGGADLEGALEAIVGEERGAEDGGELAGGVTAEEVHLEEAVARGDEGLGEDEVVDGGGADVGNAVLVTLDGYGCDESAYGKSAIKLGQVGAGGRTDPEPGRKPGDRQQDGDKDDEQQRCLSEAATRSPGGSRAGTRLVCGQAGGECNGIVRALNSVWFGVHATGKETWFLVGVHA